MSTVRELYMVLELWTKLYVRVALHILLADCVVHYIVNFVTFADIDKQALNNKMVTLYLLFVVS